MAAKGKKCVRVQHVPAARYIPERPPIHQPSAIGLRNAKKPSDEWLQRKQCIEKILMLCTIYSIPDGPCSV